MWPYPTLDDVSRFPLHPKGTVNAAEVADDISFTMADVASKFRPALAGRSSRSCFHLIQVGLAPGGPIFSAPGLSNAETAPPSNG
jgi:hypothetical protein